jgi:hypothetical protein
MFWTVGLCAPHAVIYSKIMPCVKDVLAVMEFFLSYAEKCYYTLKIGGQYLFRLGDIGLFHVKGLEVGDIFK